MASGTGSTMEEKINEIVCRTRSLQNRITILEEENASLRIRNEDLVSKVAYLQSSVHRRWLESQSSEDQQVFWNEDSTDLRPELEGDELDVDVCDGLLRLTIEETYGSSTSNSDADLQIKRTDSYLIENSFVLGAVFNYLDKKSLGSCRLVCKTWNTSAIAAYSKLWVSLRGKTEQDRVWKLVYGMGDYPKELIGKIRVDYPFLKDGKFQQWLDEHGSCLTSLHINGPFNPKVVHRVLTKYCPNLIELGIYNLNDCSGSVSFPYFSEPLKLKNIWLQGCRMDKSTEYTDCHFSFVTAIVTASPELEKLETNFGDSVNNSFDKFVRGLSMRNDSTNNLVEWRINHHASMEPSIRTFEGLLDIKFSSKLKLLHFGYFRDTFLGPEPCLTQLLRNVSSSLETLILSGFYMLQPNQRNIDSTPCSLKEIQLPLLKRLKTFENWSIGTYRLKSLKFLEKLPNLVKMTLSSHKLTSFYKILKFKNKLYPNIQELQLRSPINSGDVVQVVSATFPNLMTLHLTLEWEVEASESCPTTARPPMANGIKLLNAVFTQLGNYRCRNLKNLVVELCHWLNPYDLDVTIEKYFPRLFENLESLTLIGHSARNSSEKPERKEVQKIRLSTLTTMLRAKNLKHLKLVRLLTSMEETKDALDFARTKNILLELRNKDDRSSPP